MHATLERDAAERDSRLFLVDLSEIPEAPGIHRALERSAYGEASGPNWTTIIAIALAHLAALYALVALDVVEIAAKKKPLLVFDLAAPMPPPVERFQPKPVPIDKIEPVVQAPPPLVQSLTPPAPPIAVAADAPPAAKPAAIAAPQPAGPMAVADLDERMIEGRAPRYPVESRRKKEQGTVLLRLLIGTDGRVAQISIAQSSGFDRLDQAALQAVRSWRWQPLIRDGAPTEVRGVVPIPFVLQS